LSTEEQPEVVSTGPTARVADGYGVNPHEHKPSQDPFAPDVDEELAEAKQAVSAGAAVDPEVEQKAAEPYSAPDVPEDDEDEQEGDDEWDGTSSSESESNSDSSSEKRPNSTDSPAPTTASRTKKAPTGSSTAASTATDPKGK
jgi:hypothetical protein